MKKSFFLNVSMPGLRVISCLFLLFLVSSFVSLPVHAQGEGKDYFPLTPGSWWKYKIAELEEDMTVKVTEKKKIGAYEASRVETVRQSMPEASAIYFARTPDKIVMVGCQQSQTTQVMEFPNPVEYMRLPMGVGKTWTWKEKVLDNSGKTYSQSMKVLRSEIVSVPAGLFPTLHLLHEYTQDGVPMKKNLWYAADVGLVKWTVEDGKKKVTVVLTGYKVKN